MHLAMADEADGNENFIWDDQPWIISDNSGGEDISIDVLVGTVVEGEDKDKGKKVLDSSTSNSPNLLEGGGAVVPVEATIGKKRSAATNGGGGGGCGKKASGSGSVGGEGKGGGGDQSEHEIHIQTERERRKKMRNMFSSLQALIPNLPPKADKSTVVDEAITYIKGLQQTLKQLQKQKLEKLHGMSTRESFMADQVSSSNLATINSTNVSPSFQNISRFPSTMAFDQTWFSPNVVLNVCGEDAHISVCSFKKPGLLSMICSILDMHKLEVVSAQVSGDSFKNMYLLHIRGNSTDYQLPEGFLVEEAFKHATVDIMRWITNS